jgi:hypothetical protein
VSNRGRRRGLIRARPKEAISPNRDAVESCLTAPASCRRSGTVVGMLGWGQSGRLYLARGQALTIRGGGGGSRHARRWVTAPTKSPWGLPVGQDWPRSRLSHAHRRTSRGINPQVRDQSGHTMRHGKRTSGGNRPDCPGLGIAGWSSAGIRRVGAKRRRSRGSRFSRRSGAASLIRTVRVREHCARSAVPPGGWLCNETRNDPAEAGPHRW